MNAQDILRKILSYPIALGSVILAVVLIAIFVFRGLGIEELEQSILDSKRTRDTLSSNRKNSFGLKEDLEKLSELESLIDDMSLVSEERSANIAYFYDFEEKQAADMVSISQKGVIAPNSNTSMFTNLESRALIPFDLSITGTFNEALSYAYNLSTGEKIARITAINLGTSPSLDGTVSMDLNVLILGEGK
ncbi:MAG: hypothetical protein ACPGN3_06465 [Opitutales bacterium]